MTKFKNTTILLLVLCSIVGRQSWLTETASAGPLVRGQSTHLVVRRQATNARPSSNNNLRPPVSFGQASSMSMASSSSSGPPSPDISIGAGSVQVDSAAPNRPNKQRPQMPDNNQNLPFGNDDDTVDYGDQQISRPNRKRRPPIKNVRPQVTRPSHYNDDDEYDGPDNCDDYGDEHSYMFDMAIRPMRQLSQMMGGVFDQMQGMARGFEDYPGANYAIASSNGNNDGYSRSSSIVSNNGRRRGIVSETRNGRTRTTRIGDSDGDDE